MPLPLSLTFYANLPSLIPVLLLPIVISNHSKLPASLFKGAPIETPFRAIGSDTVSPTTSYYIAIISHGLCHLMFS